MRNFCRIPGLLLLFTYFSFVDVSAQAPCTGAPGANSTLASQTIVCPGSTVSLSLLNSYTVTGITYQWRSSTVSQVGPYTSISGATLSTYTTAPLNTSTYFQCLITCTNVNQSTASAYVYIVVGPALTTSTVPYYEDFEGISYTNQLPNCSWLAPNIGSTVFTYTTAMPGNRIPCSGTKFCSFSLPSNNNVVYTNGIQMSPGITYSAALFFETEYFGYTNWSLLEILVGPNQSTTGLVQVASTGPAVSGPCKLLSGTFTVPSSGFYYVAVRATAVSGNALYLSFDALSVTAACGAPGNSPTITVSPNTVSVCAGALVTATASGADTYTWSTGAIGPVVTTTAVQNTILSVSGTKTLTGCISIKTLTVLAFPSPTVFVIASKNAICPGETTLLNFYGGPNYTLNPPSGTITSNSQILVSPTVSICYTITSGNAFGCESKSTICVTVHTLPNVSAVYSPTVICPGEEVLLSGSGAFTYQWNGFAPGNPVKAYPNNTTSYTVFGTDANGCTNSTTISVMVDACTGLKGSGLSSSGTLILPNPNKGEFIIESIFEGGFKVTISDLLGRIILQQESKDKRLFVDLKNFPNGIYYSKIEYLNSIETIRVIKE